MFTVPWTRPRTERRCRRHGALAPVCAAYAGATELRYQPGRHDPHLQVPRVSDDTRTRGTRSGVTMNRILSTVFLGLMVGGLLCVLLVPGRARAVDLNVSGSVQADIMASPLSPPA